MRPPAPRPDPARSQRPAAGAGPGLPAGLLRPPRVPLRRTLLTRLETGRLVLYSVVSGLIVGALGSVWRLVLGYAGEVGSRVVGYHPPGTPGDGGLLIAFGEALPWGLLLFPLLAVVAAWLSDVGDDGADAARPGRAGAGALGQGDPLEQVVADYHAHAGGDGDLLAHLRAAGATLLAYGGGLLMGRDSSYVAVGSAAAILLGRGSRLGAPERRTLTLASVAAALGLALHAPLAAAVLMSEVLYRRFEFEFEVLIPGVLASVTAAAVYGLLWGFDPLFALPGDLRVGLLQLPLYLLLALVVTGVAWLLTRAAALVPAWLGHGYPRLLLAAVLGLLTAGLALLDGPALLSPSMLGPSTLGDGSGWLQLALSGFLGPEAGGMAALRWVLLALGARLALGGGVLVSASVGGLLGVGLPALAGVSVDPAVAALVGAASFLTVTLNVPVAATLLCVTWGGEALLPAVLAASGLAHALSGPASLLPAQLGGRGERVPSLSVQGLSVQGLTVLGRAAPAAPARPPAPAESGVGPARLYRQPVPRAWLGARVGVLSLPAGLTLLGVVRGGEALLVNGALKLGQGDELLLLGTPEVHGSWQERLRVPG